MILTVLGSSSKGNCYILENDDEALIIEAGINPKEIKKALNFDISKVKGVICSHRHFDHSKYIKDFQGQGINVYANLETFEAHKPWPFPTRIVINIREIHNVGNFKIMGFDLNHDVPNLGFYINHPETGNIVFATDTDKIPYKFDKVSTYIIEANYSMELLNKNIEAGNLPYFVAARSTNSHMDIDSTINFLKGSDLSEVKNIILIHLSGGNSDSAQFKERVERTTGKNVYIASKGLKININNQIF
jgi:phosphoribosyl 1,2-cyclic phosphodiesterase